MSPRTCAYCGSELEEGALFCGSCGHAAGADVEPPSVPVLPPVRVPAGAEAGGEPEDATTPDPAAQEPDPELAADEPAGDLVEAASETTEVRTVEAPETIRPARLSEPLLPVPTLAATAPHPVLGAGSTPPGGLELFVLQFSTGESVTVTGDGLVGRAPVREPGEVMDQLVPLADAGRSVSKTHLAFGQEGGRFWVTDRYSTNGTVLRAPGEPPRRCEPGRRYPLSRGTRIDIGDQFFVVS